MPAKDLESLGFDRFQRFTATARLIEGLASSLAPGRALEVLDVGGFDNALAAFLPGHRVRPWEGQVLSSTGGLPLADGSQEVVVALDVLEHVDPAQRGYFIGELNRVSGLALVLGFPVAAAAAAERFVLELTGSAWLAEHRQYGLPEPAEVEGILAGLGLEFTRHPNACLPSWTAMMLLMHGVGDMDLRGRICRFFNTSYAAIEDREPAYRYIYLCRRREP